MRQKTGLLLVVLLLLLMPSCRVLYPNIMFQEKGYQYFDLAQKQIDEYVIQSGDEISLKVYARDGFRLVDVIGNVSTAGYNSGTGNTSANNTGNTGNTSTNSNSGQSTATGYTYLVDNQGFVLLPVVGELFVKGYTEKELRRILADKFSGIFVDPFVIAHVENRRAIVFKGSIGSIVALNNGPTNLIEVIARSGGLNPVSKAYKIKVIRGDLKNPQVILVDLSTMEGVRRADLIIQSNDIVYIEDKRTSVATVVLAEITPYLSAITTIATLIILAKTYGK